MKIEGSFRLGTAKKSVSFERIKSPTTEQKNRIQRNEFKLKKCTEKYKNLLMTRQHLNESLEAWLMQKAAQTLVEIKNTENKGKQNAKCNK